MRSRWIVHDQICDDSEEAQDSGVLADYMIS
jgi:hypothetical protein